MFDRDSIIATIITGAIALIIVGAFMVFSARRDERVEAHRYKTIATLEAAGFVTEDNETYTRSDGHEFYVSEDMIIVIDGVCIGYITMDLSDEQFDRWLDTAINMHHN